MQKEITVKLTALTMLPLNPEVKIDGTHKSAVCVCVYLDGLEEHVEVVSELSKKVRQNYIQQRNACPCSCRLVLLQLPSFHHGHETVSNEHLSHQASASRLTSAYLQRSAAPCVLGCTGKVKVCRFT